MPKTNLEKAQEIVAKLGDGYSVREDYSGRFMFGEKCIGIVGPDAASILELAGRKGFRKARIDEMGLDKIVYWPHLK